VVEESLAGLQHVGARNRERSENHSYRDLRNFRFPYTRVYLGFFKAPLSFRLRTRSFRQAGAYVRHHAVMVPYLQ